MRRFADPVVRMNSCPNDQIAAGLTLAVMLAGCKALRKQNTALRSLHLVRAEGWLICFPSSSLMHTSTRPLSRGFTGALLFPMSAFDPVTGAQILKS